MLENIYFDSIFTSQQLLTFCKRDYAHIVIISDSNVSEIYGKQLLDHLSANSLPSSLITFPAGEAHKNRDTKAMLEDKLFELQCNRDTLLIALGGGVTTDLVGFVAATYNRGVPVIYIPTSLLAMVDASIGSKTGINTPYGKNLLGTFSDPLAVFIDTELLSTLPEDEYLAAFGEVIKHGLILDKTYFEYIESNVDTIMQRDKDTLDYIVKRSLEIKSHVVQQDKLEKGLRSILNFGHTFGHAFELLSNYEIKHGHAVMHGILYETTLAHQLNHLNAEDLYQIQHLIKQFNLERIHADTIDQDAFLAALAMDKKSTHQHIYCVVLAAIGKIHMTNDQYTQLISRELILNTLLAHSD